MIGLPAVNLKLIGAVSVLAIAAFTHGCAYREGKKIGALGEKERTQAAQLRVSELEAAVAAANESAELARAESERRQRLAAEAVRGLQEADRRADIAAAEWRRRFELAKARPECAGLQDRICDAVPLY